MIWYLGTAIFYFNSYYSSASIYLICFIDGISYNLLPISYAHNLRVLGHLAHDLVDRLPLDVLLPRRDALRVSAAILDRSLLWLVRMEMLVLCFSC